MQNLSPEAAVGGSPFQRRPSWPFLFGIEELSVQLEEPFSILPLQAICDDISCRYPTLGGMECSGKGKTTTDEWDNIQRC